MSDILLVCDHASNFIPAELANLGLPPLELQRHIAWDIGAAGVTMALSEMLGASVVLSHVSRLVIDCNRQLTSPGLIPRVSDGTPIPGNQNLSEKDKEARIDLWFAPYHQTIEVEMARFDAPILISIHSMTPTLNGAARPWQIALSSESDRRLTAPVLASLRAPGDITVGDNEPYDVDPAVDYTTPFHAIRRGIPYLQVEFRQDEIATPSGQLHWARRFADALSTAKIL